MNFMIIKFKTILMKNKLAKSLLKPKFLGKNSKGGKFLYNKLTPGITMIMQKFFKPKKGKITAFRSNAIKYSHMFLLLKELNLYEGISTKKYSDYFSRSIFARILGIPFNIVRSEIIIVEDNYYPLKYLNNNDKQIIIQLCDKIDILKNYDMCSPEKHKNTEPLPFDYILDPGKKLRKTFIESLGVNDKILKGIFNPKVDLILNEDYKKKIQYAIYSNHPELKGRKVILYAPAIDKEKIPEETYMNIREFVNNLDSNFILIMKKPPSDILTNMSLPDKDDNRYKFIKNINLNRLLFVTDFLITDFNQIFLEAVIHEKSVYFFSKEKLNEEKELFYKCCDFSNKKIYSNENNLAINIVNSNFDKIKNSNIEIKNKYFGNMEHNNAIKLSDFILKKIMPKEKIKRKVIEEINVTNQIRISKKINKFIIRTLLPINARIFQIFFKVKNNKVTSFGTKNVGVYLYKSFEEELKNIDGIDLKRYNHFASKGWIGKLLLIPFDLATSKIIIIEEVYRPTKHLNRKKGQIIIQTWHALGAFKKFGLANAENSIKNDGENYKELLKSYTFNYTLDPGLKFREKYLESFSPGCKILEGIFNPRIDFLFNEEEINSKIKYFYNKYPQLKGKKIILYAPTFRGTLDRESSTGFLEFNEVLDAIPKEYMIILKKHPSIKMISSALNISEKNQERFMDLSIENVNSIMLFSDYVITDYSSVFFEAAILKKPCLFLAKDIDQYLDDRGFYFDYYNFVPGPICYSEEDLINELKKLYTSKNPTERIDTFVKTYFGKVYGNNKNKLSKFIVKKLNESDKKNIYFREMTLKN